MRRPWLPLAVVPLDMAVGVGLALDWPLWLLALVHGTAALATGAAWRHATDSPLIARRGAVVTLGFPVIGSLAVWLCYPKAGEEAAGLVDEYRAFIAYEQPAAAAQRPRDVDEALRTELSVRPLVEVLRRGDLAAKQGAASALAATESPDAVRQLRDALVDPDDETRLFASLALVRMEETFLERLEAARARDEADGTPKTALARARLTLTYAETGLPAPAIAVSFFEEGEAAGQRASRSPDASEAVAGWLETARARRALGDLDGAIAACAGAEALAPGAEAVLRARMETAYAGGDLEAVAALAPQLATAAPEGSDAALIAEYWQAQEPRRPHAR